MITEKSRRLLKTIGFRIMAVALIFLGLTVLADISIRPLVETVNAHESRSRVNTIINTSVADELVKSNVDYSKLVDLTLNTDGEVVSVESNIININLLRSNISERIERELQRLSAIDINIPVGTLTGLQLLYGKGFDLELDLYPVGSSSTRMISEFTDAGINQTRHRMIVEIDVTVEAIIPGYSTKVPVHTSVIAAETIIIGRVPDAYTHVVSADDNLVGSLEDYNADQYY